MNIKKILNKPKVIGVIADVNQGKSMFLYHLLEEAKKEHTFKLFYYGLRLDIEGVEAQRIYSVAEMEAIQSSIIIVDELSSLLDLDNRKSKRQIENTLRLINHNNNILIMCGTPENFKKFLCAKLDEVFYKRTTIADFINGCTAKNILNSYKGYEKGAELLNLPINQVLHYDGKHYTTQKVPYYAQYDSKKDNEEILKCFSNCAKNVSENVQKVCIKKPINKDLEQKGFIRVVEQ